MITGAAVGGTYGHGGWATAGLAPPGREAAGVGEAPSGVGEALSGVAAGEAAGDGEAPAEASGDWPRTPIGPPKKMTHASTASSPAISQRPLLARVLVADPEFMDDASADRVVASRVPRVAARDAPGAHPAAA